MPTKKRSEQEQQPKYRAIADYLREGILNGTFPEGPPYPLGGQARRAVQGHPTDGFQGGEDSLALDT
jgi:hypothetical protein